MPLRVLLVQSDVQSAQTLTRFFQERGDEVWYAGDEAQGLNLMIQGQPDLMLVDLHFPGSDWLGLLRQARQANPPVKLIMTNKYPDLQRELKANENGATVFLRQPYTQRWIETALQHALETAEPQTQRTRSRLLPAVKLPVQAKITGPYLLLALLFALAGAYIITQLTLESVQDRYLNHLIEAGRQTADGLVREEDRLLSSERLLANVKGLAQAIRDQDAETARALVFPLGATTGEEAVEVVDLHGVTLVSMRLKAGGGPGDYEFNRGDSYIGQQPFTQSILAGQPDGMGDKYSGMIEIPSGAFFYVGGPVYSETNQVVGAVLVGRSLRSIARQTGQDTLAEVTFYNFEGQPLASTLSTDRFSLGLATNQVDLVIANQVSASLTRTLSNQTAAYAEILGPWQARDKQDLGVLGAALPQNYLTRTSGGMQLEIFLLVSGAFILVVMVGLYLAGLITRPLARLVYASREVAQGNLEVKVDSSGNDEMAVLAHSFNYMVAGLQEGSVYRDLLGRTVSPEVRDQLRQTFTSGNLKLEGQESVASVLMTDIREFTSLSETTDPSTVLAWLNEYFGRLVPIIQAHGGVVNKFDGDAMLAFFGILPRRQTPQNGALAACQAGLEILQVIDQLNQERVARGDPPLVTGIGINTGVVIAGGLGTSDRLHYTIIGDTVNITQRLESLSRQLYTTSGIVIGHGTWLALGENANQFHLEMAGLHAVKGKSELIEVYRLIEVPAATEAGE